MKAVKVRSEAPSRHWVFIPAFALVGFVFFLQRWRSGTSDAIPAAA